MEKAKFSPRIPREKNTRQKKKEAKKETVKQIREIRLLEQGFKPQKTKIGSEFKGKNRVIIS